MTNTSKSLTDKSQSGKLLRMVFGSDYRQTAYANGDYQIYCFLCFQTSGFRPRKRSERQNNPRCYTDNASKISRNSATLFTSEQVISSLFLRSLSEKRLGLRCTCAMIRPNLSD